MIILRKKFSATQILDTNSAAGFIKGRKYDTDLDRLGRLDTAQRELQKIGKLNKNTELKKLSKELNKTENLNKDSEIRKMNKELNFRQIGKTWNT